MAESGSSPPEYPTPKHGSYANVTASTSHQSWSFANPSHIIIKLHLEEDYNKLWMGTIWSLGDCPMRVFKWTPLFNPKMEAPLAPVRIRLPGLPIHFFNHNALFAICEVTGTPLQVDSLTATRSRLSMARVCVELDLLKEKIPEIILEFAGTTHVQKIVYERIPNYCIHCKHIGHSIEGCYMNGNKAWPPPPVRRPTLKSAPDGQVSKGPNGNIEKLRGTMDNSKSLNTATPNPNPGVNHAITKNQACIMVNKKGPRETGLVSKDFLNSAKKSKHTNFEGSQSNDEGSGTNRFSILEKRVFEPLDDLPLLIEGRDEVNNLKLDARDDPKIVDNDMLRDVAVAKNLIMERASLPGLDNGDITHSYVNGVHQCPTHSVTILSAIEKNIHTHGLDLKRAHDSNLDIISGPHTNSDYVEYIGKNLSSSLNMNMAEKVGDNMIYGAVPLLDLEAGLHKVSKRNICGSISNNITPQFSKSATFLDGVIGQQECQRNLHASGPKSTIFHAKLVEDSLHVSKLDHKYINWPCNPSTSCVMATNQVGPDFIDPPLINSSTNVHMAQFDQHPSVPYAIHKQAVFLIDNLGPQYYHNEAQDFSSTPGQPSLVANGPKPNSFTPPFSPSISSSPIMLSNPAQSAESSCPPPGVGSSAAANQVLDPAPLATVQDIEDEKLIQICTRMDSPPVLDSRI
ncbi:hypothetical protein DH2020_045648 [Rehmannia glutinosa]|uniref:DUF4283 domain-containing protein n=1 Tax=Rehmannia glutinosa TaxID=99300 RepID=A0ABR0UEI0_REHGL